MPHSPLIKDKPLSRLEACIGRAQGLLLSHQFEDGYWWYTLEANESISAEYIFMTEFLGATDSKLNQAICRRILQKQRNDGSWALYFGGPGDPGASIECYWALKLCGYPLDHPAMEAAKYFILKAGGPTKARVFTKIHMAMFGLAPWESAPAMPLSLILAPSWSPINVYEFSSWGRACIIPLLVILDAKPVHSLKMDLEELYPEPPDRRNWNYVHKGSFFSLENFFVQTDIFLKTLDKLKWPKPLRSAGQKACEAYLRKHIAKTEDIFPALSYGAMAMKSMGYDLRDHTIKKALKALQSFQQVSEEHLAPIPESFEKQDPPEMVHQQCCISPVWDTPWAAMSLLESGLNKDHPALKKTLRYLLTKQITETRGDWAVKNPKGIPGGWAFEFENDYFPDVDDTIEILSFLFHMGLEDPEVRKSFNLGFDWLLSMRSKNGGWAAFDVDNTLTLVNRIPFSDHGACLDPPTPDITGRILEFLALIGHDPQDKIAKEAIKFILKEQLPCGAWDGRWGVNYLYGTWCVLQGLAAIGLNPKHPAIKKATQWFLSQQNEDGGWGESCEGDLKKEFTPLGYSVPSQTAWALMGLLAVDLVESPEVEKGFEFLLRRQNEHGCWDEEEFTGTGFPGHFYIRYHGYRHYFPLLALGKYRQALNRE